MKSRKKYLEHKKIKVTFSDDFPQIILSYASVNKLLTNILYLYLSDILATEYHLGTLKAKLAKYRGQLLEPSGKTGEKGEGFDVLKSGDARAVMIGFPSVGKVRLN